MRRQQRGFGLLDMLLALSLGLLLLTGAGQLLVAAHQSWRLHGAALQLQSDARLVLLRMAQDIRMAGMFGCLRLQPQDFQDPSARRLFERPLDIGPSSLSLVTAELPGHYGAPDWTLLTDCKDFAQVAKGRPADPGRHWAIAISRHRYALQGSALMFSRRTSDTAQVLIDNVRELRIERVQQPEGDRLDLSLTLYDPALALEQRHALSVALRNPVAAL